MFLSRVFVFVTALHASLLIEGQNFVIASDDERRVVSFEKRKASRVLAAK